MSSSLLQTAIKQSNNINYRKWGQGTNKMEDQNSLIEDNSDYTPMNKNSKDGKSNVGYASESIENEIDNELLLPTVNSNSIFLNDPNSITFNRQLLKKHFIDFHVKQGNNGKFLYSYLHTNIHYNAILATL